jgi:DNA-binding FadR family transcriptional regulator
MHRKIQRYRELSVESQPKARKSGEEHTEIFKAISSHDSKLAQALGNQHTLNAKSRMLGEQ